MQPIGSLAKLRRYPVKSMMGEDLASAFVAFSGLAGDRVYAFVNKAKKDNFPWHSARQQHDLLLYRPRFLAELSPALHYPPASAFSVSVTTPQGRVLPIDSAELLEEIRSRSGVDVELRFSERGMHDERPLSLFGLDTVRGLEQEVGQSLDHRRFRANFYAQWHQTTPFYEDELVGKRLRIGETLEIEVVKKDPRCVMINVDPDTGVVDPAPLKTIAKGHRGCAGVYAAVLREGVAAHGDTIYLL